MILPDQTCKSETAMLGWEHDEGMGRGVRFRDGRAVPRSPDPLLHLTQGNDFRDAEGNRRPAHGRKRNAMNANEMLNTGTAAVARLWTRVGERQQDNSTIKYHSLIMANGLLKKLGLAAAITGSALLDTKEVNAATVPWSSYTDIVPTLAPGGYGNPFEGQPISSINYSSSSSVSAPSNFSAIYFIIDGAFSTPVGGFDVRDGVITSASFNGFSTWYGLTSGDTANSAEGSNPQNRFGGYWEVFYDNRKADGSAGSDSVLGTFVTDDYGNFQYFLDRNEQLTDNQYDISNFTPYGAEPGTFTFTANIPEPSTGVLTTLGIAALALPSGANVVHFRIGVTNLSTFRVEYRNSLTNTAWSNLGTFSATGAVTEVADTNTVPMRFYRAVSP